MTYFTAFKRTLARARGWAMQHPRRALVGVILLTLLVALWVLTRPGALLGQQDGTWKRVQINHDLYVGMVVGYKPFAEWTPDGIIGMEADIAREMGRRLSAEAHILIQGYDGLYNSLYVGEVDMLISGLSFDAGQTNWVYYSQPYFDAGQILVSREGTPVQRMEQLDGKTIGVELASAGHQEAQRWERRLHALNIMRYMLPEEAIAAVQRGDVDAALVDTVSARRYVEDYDDLVIARKTAVRNGYMIAMRKENFRLTAEVERVLAEMIADGTLDEIVARWL